MSRRPPARAPSQAAPPTSPAPRSSQALPPAPRTRPAPARPPRPRPGPPSSALQRRVCILPAPRLARWAMRSRLRAPRPPLPPGRASKRDSTRGRGTRGRGDAGPAYAVSGPGREEALPPPGSQGRPVTPPAPPPRGPVAKLASPAATRSLPERHRATWHCLLGSVPRGLGPAPPPGGHQVPRCPSRAAPRDNGSPIVRPRFISATTSPSSLGSGCHGCPVSQKCRSRLGR